MAKARRYWRVYEVLAPDLLVPCEIFVAPTATKAIEVCRRYHEEKTLRSLGPELVATEVTDKRQFLLAIEY
jgi:hypothetical protein